MSVGCAWQAKSGDLPKAAKNGQSHMDESSIGSVSAWLAELRSNHGSAAQALWNRYFAQLVNVARRNLCGRTRDVDEEDIALNDEIARGLDVSTRTIERKLARIRQEW